MKKATMKRTIAAALCITALLCGCSEKKDTSTDSKQLKEMSAKIDGLTDKVDKLNNKISEYEELIDEDDISFDDDIHPIYDDTAVIEAYKSGDDSKLTDEKDKYILTELKKAIDEIISEDMSDYEKEKAVYDYIYKNTQFDEDSLNAISEIEESDYSHTPYGFFHDHNVICVGDATTFKLFMDALDIDCKIIHSTEQGEHAWDVVKVDGDWYHVDVLFDGGFGEPAYAFFNVPDSAKEMGDYPWDRDEDDIPECTSTKYCYICNNAEKIDSVYDLPEKMKELLDSDEAAAYYSIDLPEGVDGLSAAMQMVYMNNSIIMNMDCFYGINAVVTDDGKSICFGVSVVRDAYDDDNGKKELSGEGLDIDYEKLDEQFREYLGDHYSGYEFYDGEAFG
ncbi:MAG: hypothetical protein IJ571_02855 [Ruminococcus sp.]|nr:hypothetical protein [Ruminococcus sp.]